METHSRPAGVAPNEGAQAAATGRTKDRKEGGQKVPQCGRGSGGSGGCGLGGQMRGASLSSSALGTLSSRRRASYTTKGFPGTGPDGSVTPRRDSEWVALTEEPECAPRRGLWIVS